MSGGDGTPESRLAAAGIELREPLSPGALYSAVVVDAGLAYVSGTVAVAGPPWTLDYPGRLGDDLELEDGRRSAASAIVTTLSNLRGALGDLNRVDRFVKLVGYVRCTPDFGQTPAVIDGASEVLAIAFGADSVPARSAIGVASLPYGASVEVEAIVRLRQAPPV